MTDTATPTCIATHSGTFHADDVFGVGVLMGVFPSHTLLSTELRQMVLQKAAVVQSWVDAGRMAPVDPIHLFFTIWAATQTYADFDVQVSAVLGRPKLTRADQARATEHVVALLLRGCGLEVLSNK